jgi:hypothetical protein
MVYKASFLVLAFYFTTYSLYFLYGLPEPTCTQKILSTGSFVVVVLRSRLLPDHENENVSILIIWSDYDLLPRNVQFTRHSLARNRSYVHLVPGYKKVARSVAVMMDTFVLSTKCNQSSILW